MVLLRYRDLMYVPLAAAGFALMMASISAFRFSHQLLLAEGSLANGAVHNGGLVHAVLHLTGFDVGDGLGHIHGDRAALGVRHQALRAQDTADTAHQTHHVRGGHADVETRTSFPAGSWRSSLRRPRNRRLRPRPPWPSRPWQSPARGMVRPVPWGRTTAPRTCWSAWRGSTPRRTEISTVSSNLALLVFSTRSAASSGSYCFSGLDQLCAVRYISCHASCYSFLPCGIKRHFVLPH